MDLRLYAHRGASRRLPENTLPAFERGLSDGATALELDVHRTADGAVVVSHDADGRRMAGTAQSIAATPLDALRRWDAGWGFVDRAGGRPFAGQGFTIPTFEEVLQAFPATPLNVDLKDPDARLVRSAVELVARAGADARVTLASFEGANLAEVRRLGYRGPAALSPNAARWLVLAPRWLSTLVRPRGDALEVPPRTGRFRLDRPKLIAQAHALGLRVDFWVVDDPAQARQLWTAGADGIVTNDPAAIAPVFQEQRAARDRARTGGPAG